MGHKRIAVKMKSKDDVAEGHVVPEQLDTNHECPGSGSGVWEKCENRKWEIVTNTKHRIPSRTRMRSEGSLDPCLSIHKFIANFDVEEEQPNASRLISDGNTVIRVDETVNKADDEANNAEEQEEDPMEGTSSGSRTRRVEIRVRRRSSQLSSPEQQPPVVATAQMKTRRRRRRKRRKLILQNGRRER